MAKGKVPTFGTSAFLRLISSTPRVQRGIIRKRLLPSGKGYDFHKGFRARATELLVAGRPADEMILSCETIKKEPERNAAKTALRRLAQWRAITSGPVLQFDSVTYESPAGIFKVSFEPDFGMSFDGVNTAVHLWNTKSPDLDVRLALSSLSLFAEKYRTLGAGPGDLAIFSLRTIAIHRLRQADFDHASVAQRMIESLERLFEDVRAELRLPPSRESPSAPPPP